MVQLNLNWDNQCSDRNYDITCIWLDGLRVLGDPGIYLVCRLQWAGMVRVQAMNLHELVAPHLALGQTT
jgi:hypothetical protein